jgi:cytochrome P450
MVDPVGSGGAGLFADFDLHDTAQAPQLYDTLDAMRQTCPVAHSDRWGGQWLLTTFDDVTSATRQTTIFSSRRGATHPQHPYRYEPLPINLDPPEHRSVRAFLQPHFSRTAIEASRIVIEGFVHDLIGGLVGDGECEAVSAIATPVPLMGLATVMDVPRTELPAIRQLWLDMKATALTDDLHRRAATAGSLFDYLEALIQTKRSAPDDGVMSSIANGTIDGAAVTREQALGMAYLLMVAGHDTTVAGIAWLLYYLARDPALRDRLIEQPELSAAFVDEVLRFDCPVPGMARTTTREVDVGGITIPADEHVLVMFASANRDPARFEHPDDIRLDRTRNPHLAFGSGVHRCLGEHLARLEMHIVLEAVLARMPNIHLADTESPDLRAGFVRGPDAFRIRW